MKKSSDIQDQVVNAAQALFQSGLITDSYGNISLFDRQNKRLAVTRSGAACQHLNQSDVILLDQKGRVVEGKGKPTSELSFHLALYQKRDDVNAIIHTHSTYATTLACLGWELPAVHYLIGFAGKKVPVAPYATFGSTALAKSVTDTIGEGNALLLANHGLIAVGQSLDNAFRVAREVEFTAKIFYLSKCVGTPVVLDDNEMANVIAKFRDYGQPDAL